MFVQQLKLYFLIITVVSTFFLGYRWYKDYEFNKNKLSTKLMQEVYYKQRILRSLAIKHYNIHQKIPIKISDKLPDNLFGAATLDKQNNIIIYLNKKRFQESSDYMIDDVLLHEYAHALMFVKGDISQENGGHTLKWQKICQNLEGKKCDRFVNNKDIIIGKTGFLY